jgi:hypothetical protein
MTKTKTKTKTKRPKRPAISIKTETYEKVQAYCKERGIPVSTFVTSLAEAHLAKLLGLEGEGKRKQ